VADATKSELQQTALVLMHLKNQNKQFEDHISAMENLTDVLNSNIGVFTRKDDLEVYKAVKNELAEQDDQERKQSYGYFNEVFRQDV